MKRAGLAAITLGAMVALASAAPVGALTDSVRIRDRRFRPGRLVIERGDRVRWVNQDDVAHTSTGPNGLWDRVVDPGETAYRRFRRARTYSYICRFHDDMKGKIIVLE